MFYSILLLTTTLLLFGRGVQSSNHCADDIRKLGQSGVTTYGEMPIQLTSQDVSTVTLTLKQTWDTGNDRLKYAYVNYEVDGVNECVKFENLAKDEESNEIVATCLATRPYTVVNVCVSDDSFDPIQDVNEINACCHPPTEDVYPKVCYSYVLMCESTCDDSEKQQQSLDIGERNADDTAALLSSKDRVTPGPTPAPTPGPTLGSTPEWTCPQRENAEDASIFSSYDEGFSKVTELGEGNAVENVGQSCLTDGRWGSQFAEGSPDYMQINTTKWHTIGYRMDCTHKGESTGWKCWSTCGPFMRPNFRDWKHLIFDVKVPNLDSLEPECKPAVRLLKGWPMYQSSSVTLEDGVIDYGSVSATEYRRVVIPTESFVTEEWHDLCGVKDLFFLNCGIDFATNPVYHVSNLHLSNSPIADVKPKGYLPSPFGDGGAVGDPIRLESSTCDETVIMTNQPHIGTEEDDVLELTVHITDTKFFEENDGAYQPHVAVFLAKPDAKLEAVTTDDEGWSYFESQVVGWMKGKIHCCLDTTYFYAKTLVDVDNNEMALQQSNTGTRMESNAAMRIRRQNGQMTYWFSMNGGLDWEQIGEAADLPVEYHTGPLKVGYRIKREYHCLYDITTIPNVVSGGPVEYIGPELPVSYFDESNSLVRDSVEFEEDGSISFSSDLGSQQALLVSQETFEDNVSIQVQLTERLLFGEGKWQSGLWLFFVTEDMSDLAAYNLHENSWDNFVLSESTIGAFGDKVLNNGGDNTWFDSRALNIDGTHYSASGTERYQNLDGYMRLERHHGFIQVFKSPNGAGWQNIGDVVELPEAYRTSKVRIGLCIKSNWNVQYSLSFVATVDTTSVDTSRIEAYLSPTPSPTPEVTVGDVVISRSYSSSYFDCGSNTLTTNRVACENDYIRFSSAVGTDNALMLSTETFTGSISFTVEVLYRQLFGDAYQGGIWLFFADPNAHPEVLFATNDPCDWNDFQNAAIAAFGDKLHGEMVNTFLNSHVQLAADNSAISEQGGVESYRNIEGNLKLERDDEGIVSTYIQENSQSPWEIIGNPVQLPDVWKTAPVKIGVAWRDNFNADYQIAFSTTVVGQVTQRNRKLLRGEQNRR